MFCPACGSPCEENVQFCPNCGKELTQKPTEATETPAAEPVVETVAAQPEAPVAAPKKQNNIALIMGIIAAVDCATLGCLCSCLGSLPGIICAIVGLVLGMKEKSINPDNKNNNIGIILCIVALVLAFVFIIINAILGGLSGLITESYYYY